MTEKRPTVSGPRLTAAEHRIEQLAQQLHTQACLSRGDIPKWAGRRTNRAYYRRKAARIVEKEQ